LHSLRASRHVIALTPNGDTRLAQIRAWAQELGFSQIGVSGIDLSSAEPGLRAWMAAGFAGTMQHFERHGLKRARPAELLPGTVSVITARLDYLPASRVDGEPDDAWIRAQWQTTADPLAAQVALYARGRDYHRVLRPRLARLADRIRAAWGDGGRAFTDSAPVLECELAARSGLGWRGKHTLVLSREAGSMFFLGELFVDFALPATEPVDAHCGSCTACIDVCPTQAIVAPGRLDARRCISYLTIEHDGPIPLALRPLMGNRIVGCDDCQLVCPWNKYAQRATLGDFDAREPWAHATLLRLWGWSADEFERHTEGSAIRRVGYTRWRRNLAVAMGNALRSGLADDDDQALRRALQDTRDAVPAWVAEHIDWALGQHPANATQAAACNPSRAPG
jgi:epoxyqueuosine reductase